LENSSWDFSQEETALKQQLTKQMTVFKRTTIRKIDKGNEDTIYIHLETFG